MNIERMRKVAADVLAHAEQFDMSAWFISPRGNFVEEVSKIPPEGLGACGTTCCIAGAAVLRAMAEKFPVYPYANIETAAAAYLDLDWDEKRRLFYVSDWDVDLKDDYLCTESHTDQAQAAVEQIERMIAEEEGNA